MNIRTMTKEDMPHMHTLIAQLGYPSSYENLQQRLTHILALDNYETLVAEIDNVCVGFVGMCKQWRTGQEHTTASPLR